MVKQTFDGRYELTEPITIDHIIEKLPDEHGQRFIKEYKEEDSEEWELIWSIENLWITPNFNILYATFKLRFLITF